MDLKAKYYFEVLIVFCYFYPTQRLRRVLRQRLWPPVEATAKAQKPQNTLPKEIAKARTENEMSYKVIGAAIEIHKSIGPGLLEPAYENAMAYDLRGLGFDSKQHIPMPLQRSKTRGRI